MLIFEGVLAGLHPGEPSMLEVTNHQSPRAVAVTFHGFKGPGPKRRRKRKRHPEAKLGRIPGKTTLQGTDIYISPLLKAPFGWMNFPNFPFWLGYGYVSSLEASRENSWRVLLLGSWWLGGRKYWKANDTIFAEVLLCCVCDKWDLSLERCRTCWVLGLLCLFYF